MRVLIFVSGVLVMLAGCAQLDAAPPQARIVGPTAAVPGDKIYLDASRSTDASTYRWEVHKRPGGDDREGHVTDSSGQVLELFSYPGEYEITLAVANSEGIDLKRWRVVVYAAIPPGPQPPAPEPAPTPPEPSPPGPNPPLPTPPGPTPPEPAPTPPEPPRPEPPQPDPEPALPDGTFAISQQVCDQVCELAIAADQRSAQANRVAEGFESVAAAISAGSLAGVDTILSEIRDRNRSALGQHLTLWKPFDTWLAVRLSKLYGEGRLSQPPDWAVLLRELALGLRAAARKTS